MWTRRLLALAILSGLVQAQSTGSACGTSFCINASYDGTSTMTYTLTSTNPLTNGWAAVGEGQQMSGTDMFILWAVDNKVLLSQRKGSDAAPPNLNSEPVAKLDTANTYSNSSGVEAVWTVPHTSLPAGDWNMIWAFNDANLPGPDVSGRLQMHTRYGRMKVPMLAVATRTSNEPVPLPTPSIVVDNGSDLGYDAAKHDRIVWAHAAMMCLAWGIVCPTAILIARFGRGLWSRWVMAHQIIQVPILFVVLCIGLALGITAREISSGEHGRTQHALLGMSVCGLYCLQLVLGMVTHALYDPQRIRRPMQNWAHMVLGILIVVLAAYTVHTGIVLFGVKQWGKTLYWVWIGELLAAAYLGGFAMLPRQIRAEREAKASANPSVRLQNIRTAAQAFENVSSPALDTATSDSSTSKGLYMGSSVQLLVNSPVTSERVPSLSRTSRKASKGWL